MKYKNSILKFAALAVMAAFLTVVSPAQAVTKVANDTGNGFHYVVSTSEIAALGAATSGNIPIMSLPKGAIVNYIVVKHSASVTGGSISAATARLNSANNAYGSGALNVFAAASNTAITFDGVQKRENFAAATPMYLTVTSTGANLSAVTAGSITVWISYTVL